MEKVDFETWKSEALFVEIAERSLKLSDLKKQEKDVIDNTVLIGYNDWPPSRGVEVAIGSAVTISKGHLVVKSKI